MAGADAGTWRWRVSLATIERDAPFSRFPGVDRVSLLLAGTELALEEANGQRRLRLGLYQSASYDGDTEHFAHVLGAPLQCLNVMTMRGQCQARLQLVSQPTRAQGECVMLVLKGSFSVSDGAGRDKESLLPDHGLVTPAQSQMRVVPLTPDSLLTLATFTAA